MFNLKMIKMNQMSKMRNIFKFRLFTGKNVKLFCDKENASNRINPSEMKRQFYTPDSPYVKEVTDKIYPKLPNFQKTITGEDIDRQFNEVNSLIEKKEYDQAFGLSRQLLNDCLVFDSVEGKINLIYAYNLIGRILVHLNDHKSAIENFIGALDVYVNLKDECNKTNSDLQMKNVLNEIQNSILRIGNSYSILKNFENSNMFLLKLLQSENVKLNTKKNLKNYFETLRLIANNYLQIGEYEKSKFYYETILKEEDFSKEVSKIMKAEIYTNLGISFSHLSSSKEDLKYFKMSYELLKDEFEGGNTNTFDNKHLKSYLLYSQNYALTLYKYDDHKEALELSTKLDTIISHMLKEKSDIDTLLNEFLVQFNVLIAELKTKIDDFEGALETSFKLISTIKKLDLNLKANSKMIELLHNTYSNSFAIFFTKIENQEKKLNFLDRISENILDFLQLNLINPTESHLNLCLQNCNDFYYSLQLLQLLSNKNHFERLEETLQRLLFLINTHKISDVKLKSDTLLTIANVCFTKGEYKDSLQFVNQINELSQTEKFVNLYKTRVIDTGYHISDAAFLYNDLMEQLNNSAGDLIEKNNKMIEFAIKCIREQGDHQDKSEVLKELESFLKK